MVFTCESWKIEVGVENLGLGEHVGVANFAVFVPPTPTPILPELFQHTHLTIHTLKYMHFLGSFELINVDCVYVSPSINGWKV